MLAPMDIRTLTLRRGSRSMMAAGRKAHSERENSLSNTSSISELTWVMGFITESTAYMMMESISGRRAVLIMAFTFSNISVPVTAATRLALEDTGEHLSPKYTPLIRAPAVSIII